MAVIRPCLSGLIVMSLTGCLAVAVAAGAAAVYGTVLYTENEAQRDFAHDYGATLDATIAAMRTNGYPVPDDIERGATESKIEVSDVVARVEKHPGAFTRVRVRVGTFRTDDHKRKAKLILEQVARTLGE